MRNLEREAIAKSAANFIKGRYPQIKKDLPKIGIILGTGWDKALAIKEIFSLPLTNLNGFQKLEKLAGHERRLIYGEINDKKIIALNGRVHLNEAPYDINVAKMVRLQVEILFWLGVKKLIITNAAGGLGKAINVGEIAIIDGFVTLFAPDMPLWSGEFCSPEDTIDKHLISIAHHANKTSGELITKKLGYAMVRGPQFEGRKYDKAILATSGAGVVGMSSLPEACIAALYKVKTLTLSFVTNNDKEEHSHKENTVRVNKSSALLGKFLTEIIKNA
jgi:purine-nucleoside phosphorylase